MVGSLPWCRNASAEATTQARRPGELAGGGSGIAVQPCVEAAAREELVDEEAVGAGAAEAEEARQAGVAEHAEHLQLGAELVVPLAPGGVVGGLDLVKSISI
jgi:hypothetical protein